MRKIRVCIVTADLSIGGGQQVVYELAKNLVGSSVDFEVLCYAGKSESYADSKADGLFPIQYQNFKGKATVQKILGINRAINEFDPDIVHAHLGGVFYSVIWALLHHGRIVITAHTKPSQAFSKRIEPAIRFLLKKKRACIVGVSEENKKALEEYFDIHDERIHCVNNGVDLTRFYRKDHEQYTLINVARQDENKNQIATIRCFKMLHRKYPNTKLILLGDGPTHKELIKEAGSLIEDKSVEMPGMVSNTEDYYAISDVYVQSSHREAMPMSMLEAMAAGLPLISTDVGGVRDIIVDNGIIVPDNDENSLLEAMLQLFECSSDIKRSFSQKSKK